MQDASFMATALKLAEKGRYTTDPNPRVACILVRDNKIIAEGWHMRAGQAHAEIIALGQTTNAKGATAYVTLEPCSHYGKTGPCCEALIVAGIKRVVVAMQDPNPIIAGQGIKKLLQTGLVVDCGVLQQEAESLNLGFIKRMTTLLPFVRSKLAMSLDGKTALESGESQWITSSYSRVDVQWLRAESSAILTGINTIISDNPSLNVRLDIDVLQPIRVVLDSQLKIPLTAKILDSSAPTWILTCSNNKTKIKQITNKLVRVFTIASKDGKLDLKAVMIFLGQQQINTVLVEAGATLNGALMAKNLVDEWIFYMAPCILGDKGRGLFNLPTIQELCASKKLKRIAIRPVGPDLKMVYKTQ